MKLAELKDAVEQAAALRRIQRLQPAGGPGDKLFPPTYPVNEHPTHVFERRRIDGTERICVLIDSVQSQANRLEEALLTVADTGSIRLPQLIVDFPGAGLNSVGPISVLEAPHRIFDAILRDSMLKDKTFPKSDLGMALYQATPEDASAILQAAPTALLFGAWNSTGMDGKSGAKFARLITSEVIAVDVPAEETIDRNSGEIHLKNAGRRTGSRIDPLGIPSSIDIYKSEGDWALEESPDAKKSQPSEINHGNIPPHVDALGITCAYVQQTQVLTFAGLRRLAFGRDKNRNLAARTYLAALGILAMIEGNRQGMALRSRCDLVCEDGLAPLEIVAFDGSLRTMDIDADTAIKLYDEAFDDALKAGLNLNPDPVILNPQEKLIRLVQKAQQKTLGDEDGG